MKDLFKAKSSYRLTFSKLNPSTKRTFITCKNPLIVVPSPGRIEDPKALKCKQNPKWGALSENMSNSSVSSYFISKCALSSLNSIVVSSGQREQLLMSWWCSPYMDFLLTSPSCVLLPPVSLKTCHGKLLYSRPLLAVNQSSCIQMSEWRLQCPQTQEHLEKLLSDI